MHRAIIAGELLVKAVVACCQSANVVGIYPLFNLVWMDKPLVFQKMKNYRLR